MSHNLSKRGLEFSASVINTLSKMKKKTFVISGHDSLQVILDYLERPELLNNTGNYFREYLVSDDELARSHAESVAKIRQHYLAMGLERLFVDEIQELLDFKIKDVNRSLSKKRLDYILNNRDHFEIMQKYAYLSFLVNNDITTLAHFGIDYFRSTVFAPLFKNQDAMQICQDFLTMEIELENRYYGIVNEQIDRIPGYELEPATRRKIRDSQALAAKYGALMEAADSGKTIFDKKAYDYQLQEAVKLVALSIEKSIIKDIEEGKDTFELLLAMKCLSEGNADEEQREMLENLFLEKIIETELIKLPNYFRDQIKQIAHMHKQKVADSILLHVANKASGLSASLESSYKARRLELNQREGRVAIKLTPETKAKLESLKQLKFEDVAKDEELVKLYSINSLGLDLESKTFELIRSDSDAKLHSIIFNPKGSDIPIDLVNLTDEELAANGILKMRGQEMVLNSAGEILEFNANNKELEQMLSKIERLTQMDDGNTAKTAGEHK